MAVAEYNYEDAKKLYEEALTFDKSAKNLFDIAYFFQEYKNDYKKSVYYYEESLKLFRELAKKIDKKKTLIIPNFFKDDDIKKAITNIDLKGRLQEIKHGKLKEYAKK